MTALRLALVAALLFPTAPIPQQPPLPTIKIDTKLTVVDVTVVDKDGRPVHGLSQSDFTIKEDGKPQPIKNFDEYGTSILPAQPAPAPLPPGIYTNQPTAAPTTSAVNILLFDDINTGLNLLAKPELFIYAQHQAADYLKTLPPGTRVAIMTASDQLRLVQDFTTDKDVLSAAVTHLLYQPANGTILTIPTLELKIDPTPQVCGVANRRSHLTMDALRQLSAFTSGIHGRKNVVWFTPGIPWLTDHDRFHWITCLDDLTPQLHQAYAVLNAARAAVYTADSNGLQVAEDITEIDSQWRQLGETKLVEFEARTLDRESLQEFADATGGKAFYDRNDLDAVTREAIANGSDYYAVAYTPPLSGYDGKYHSIDVKVNKPGLHLQYRTGYTSLDLARLNNSIDHDKVEGAIAQTANVPPAITQFRAGMAHGAAPSSQLLLAARITPVSTPSKAAPLPIKGDLNPKVKTNPLIRYDVIYSLPAGQITVSEGPNNTRKASVELDVVAYGEDGTKLNVIRQTANMSLKPEQAEDFNKQPFEVPLQLDLPPGKLFVRVGVLDVLSGKAGTLEVPQTVAKP